jgi:hypothetical protein
MPQQHHLHANQSSWCADLLSAGFADMQTPLRTLYPLPPSSRPRSALLCFTELKVPSVASQLTFVV